MKQKEPHIKIVTDGKEKQRAYSEVKSRYDFAMKQGFYGEALLINYAIIEDRLKSFLFYSGGMIKKNSLTVEVDNPIFINTFGLKEDKNSKGQYTGTISVKNVKNKIKVVKKVLKKAKDYNGNNEYILMVQRGLRSTQDINEFLINLKKLEKQWSVERNEITHGLLNKNTVDLNNKYQDICNRGEELATFFDNTVRRFKERVKIRKFLELK